MIRSTRTIAALIRHLSFGAVAPLALATLVAPVLVGCQDEGQPEYHIELLKDPPKRAAAVKRLEQFWSDALTKSNQKRDTPEVKALIDKMVGPLTSVYVDNYADLDVKARVTTIKLLADLHDPRAEPAFKKALDEFAKKPAKDKDEQDIKWAVLAAADLKLPGLNDGVVAAFQKLRASTMLGGVTYKDYNTAMVAIASKSWVGPLVAMLDGEMAIPQGDDAKDPAKIDAFKDQQFWQVVAAEVLGEIGDPAAAEPLLKVVLDPGKANVAATALVAMVKIGKPANDLALKLLVAPMDDKLATFHAARVQKATNAKEAPKDSPHVAMAAMAVGVIGRAESAAPMIDALSKADKDVTRAVIARELAKLPASDAAKAAFRAAFEKISLEATVPPGYNALQMLAESAGSFFDSSLVPWLLSRAESTKGDGEALKALQGAVLITALKLAKPDQLADVKKAIDKMGTQLEKDAFAQVDKLVKECGDRAPCYLSAMGKSENQEQKNQFIAIKAGYMVAMLGNEATRDELVKALPDIENSAVRYVAAMAIDFLSPKGSKEAADKINAILEKNKESGDSNRIAGDNPLRQVMVRIRSRAG